MGDYTAAHALGPRQSSCGVIMTEAEPNNHNVPMSRA